MSSGLPLGWAVATVEQLIATDGVFSDGDWIESKDQDPEGAIRLLQLADIGDGYFLNKSNRFINSDVFQALKCTEVFEGDVLVARMPDPLGRACLAPKLDQRCITVVDVAILRPGASSVNPAWLMHFINPRKFAKYWSSNLQVQRVSEFLGVDLGVWKFQFLRYQSRDGLLKSLQLFLLKLTHAAPGYKK